MESILDADQRTGLGHALAGALIERADDAHALAFAEAGELAVSPLWGRVQRRARVRAELLAAYVAVADWCVRRALSFDDAKAVLNAFRDALAPVLEDIARSDRRFTQMAFNQRVRGYAEKGALFPRDLVADLLKHLGNKRVLMQHITGTVKLVEPLVERIRGMTEARTGRDVPRFVPRDARQAPRAQFEWNRDTGHPELDGMMAALFGGMNRIESWPSPLREQAMELIARCPDGRVDPATARQIDALPREYRDELRAMIALGTTPPGRAPLR